MIDYLRLSVIDSCNLNCFYCNPEKREVKRMSDLLDLNEIIEIVKLFSIRGIKKVRLTGGEPLLRKDIVSIVREIKNLKSILEILITTNGILLKNLAKDLKKAGITRFNISLDTLRKERFKKITGYNGLEQVLEGIEEIIRLDVLPLKINTVIFEGINDDEIEEFLLFVKEKPVILRFIEYVSTSRRFDFFEKKGISSNEIKSIIKEKYGELIHDNSFKNGPANYFRIKGFRGKIGFISGRTENFCSECNRFRVSSDGRVYPCLYSKISYSVKDVIYKSNEEKIKFLDFLFSNKKSFKDKRKENDFNMVNIGG